MRYGNTPKSVLPAICVMVLVGCAAVVFGAILMGARGDFETRWPALIMLFLLPPGAIIAVLIPTLLFCIKLEDGQVKHVFLNRYVLSQYPVADFVESTFGMRGSWPKIRFTHNRTIYFIGAYWGVLVQLDEDLKAARDLLKPEKRDGFGGPAARPNKSPGQRLG